MKISLITVTYKNIEYIIVDGASNDNTIDIVKMYESQFGDRIKYISEKDKGLYDAMNKGIDMASGDVIGILNSDDFFTSDSVLQIVAQSFLSDILFLQIIFINVSGITHLKYLDLI